MVDLAILQRPSAYLLVFHGSRDRRPEAAATALAQFFMHRIQYATTDLPFARKGSPSLVPKRSPTHSASTLPLADLRWAASPDLDSPIPAVDVAALECQPLPLCDQICQFVQSLPTGDREINGDRRLVLILPLFLLPGMHVMEDIPTQVAHAQTTLGQRFQLEVVPYLGCHPGLCRLVTERMASFPAEVWVLLSHGSRRPGANQAIEDLATRLGVVTAYWTLEPGLEFRIQELANLGCRRIAIFPYFLFSGGTTDAIALLVQRLSQQFPSLKLHLTSPFDATPELADLVVDLAEARIGES